MLRRLVLLACASLLLATYAFAQGGSATSSTGSKTATADTGTKAAAFRPTKDQVMLGQKFLIGQKLYSGEATGIYNDETRGAIKTYQKANGLAITGNFNQATLEKMKIPLTDKQKGSESAVSVQSAMDADTSADSKASHTAKAHTSDSNEPKRPAPFRANADQIKDAQKILRDGKMLTDGEDGKLDDATRDGLGKYQDAKGLKVTKTLNPATLDKMGIALTEKQKQQVAAQAAYDAAKASSKDQ